MMMIKFVATLYLPRALCMYMYVETKEGNSNFKFSIKLSIMILFCV